MILSRNGTTKGYLLDGQPVPSVSAILRSAGLAPEYGHVEPEVLERARVRGVRVHEIADALDRDEPIGPVTEELAPYRDAYVQFRYQTAFEVLATEAAVHHPHYLYAGTYDSRGRLNGHHVLIDRKATAEIHPVAVSTQLAAYRGAWNVLHPDDAVEAIFSLHLRRDGTYRLAEYDADDAWRVFQAALEIYRYKARHRKAKPWTRT